MNIFIDATMTDEARRNELYRGTIAVYSPSATALKLCRLAQDLIEEALTPLILSEFTSTSPRNNAPIFSLFSSQDLFIIRCQSSTFRACWQMPGATLITLTLMFPV